MAYPVYSKLSFIIDGDQKVTLRAKEPFVTSLLQLL